MAKFKLIKEDFEKWKKYAQNPSFDSTLLNSIKLDSVIELDTKFYKNLAKAITNPIKQHKNYASIARAMFFKPKKIITR